MSNTAATLANRLLADDAWAQSRLASHAGKSFLLSLPPFALALDIDEGGRLCEVRQSPAVYALEITLPPAALPLGLLGREALEREMVVKGDSALAEALRELADAAPWFLERELARWVGPVVAERLSRLARAMARWPVHAADRIAQSAAVYFQEEQPTLLKRHDMELLSGSVSRLRDDLARFEARLDRLAG
jgi:ubiquinone biosynthesis protein UbiJ